MNTSQEKLLNSSTKVSHMDLSSNAGIKYSKSCSAKKLETTTSVNFASFNSSKETSTIWPIYINQQGGNFDVAIVEGSEETSSDN